MAEEIRSSEEEAAAKEMDKKMREELINKFCKEFDDYIEGDRFSYTGGGESFARTIKNYFEKLASDLGRSDLYVDVKNEGIEGEGYVEFLGERLYYYNDSRDTYFDISSKQEEDVNEVMKRAASKFLKEIDSSSEKK